MIVADILERARVGKRVTAAEQGIREDDLLQSGILFSHHCQALGAEV